MKKRLFFMGVAGMLAVSIPGCRQDVDQSPPPPETALDAAVVRAQRFLESKVGVPALPNTYYKAGVNPSQTRAGETAPMLGDAIVPDWPEAKTWEYEGDIVTEVPATLTRPVTYTTLVEERGDTVSLTSQAPHTRIRAIERPDGEIYGFVITLLPDQSYSGDLSMLGSNPVGSDYSGLSLYSRFDGTPILGYRYENGMVINALMFDCAYEELSSSEVTISMGFSGGIGTRANTTSSTVTGVITVDRIIEGDGYVYIFYSDGSIFVWMDPIVKIGIGGNPGDDPFPSMPPPNIIPPGGGGNGGGGGSIPTPPPTPVAPKAKKLFDSDELTDEEWKKIEAMIDTIMMGCMGREMYNRLFDELDGLSIELIYDPARLDSRFTGLEIMINDINNTPTFFHEMFHAYQLFGTYNENVGLWNAAGAKLETEAQIAKARYMLKETDPEKYQQNLYELTHRKIGDQWFFDETGDDIVRMAKALNSSGNLIDPGKETEFMRYFSHIADFFSFPYPYNSSGDTFDSNMQSIIDLSINC